MSVMTPFHPFEVGQVDEFHDLSAMQVHLDDFLVGFPTEIALFETDVCLACCDPSFDVKPCDVEGFVTQNCLSRS